MNGRVLLRFFVTFAFVSLFGLAAYAQQTTCSGTRSSTIGGPIRLDLAGYLPNLPAPTGVMTVIDVSHPSPGLIAYPSVIFSSVFSDSQPLALMFSTVRAAGQTYRIIDPGGTIYIFPTPPYGRVEVHQIVFDHPLVFDKGDMLGVVVRPGSGARSGLVFYDSSSPQGVLAGNVDLGVAGALPLAQFSAIRSTAVAAVVSVTVDCALLPAPELFLPVVGDVQGLAHYSTDVSLYAGTAFAGPVTVNWTVRDRTRDPNSTTLMTGSASTSSTSNTTDSVGTLSGLPDSYLGSMTLTFPGYNGKYQTNDTLRLSDDAIATARITARIPLGETGSSINGVSCERIGHTIAVPFHVTANHRVNVGIASAQLNSCGIFKPSTVVVARVNDGPNVIIPMPAETIQLDNITSTNSPLAGAVGLTDGVVYFTVTDEASRIVAYSSLLDNTSQSATLTYGTVVR